MRKWTSTREAVLGWNARQSPLGRRAARLVGLELSDASVTLDVCIENRTWWLAIDPPKQEAWLAHQGLLAADLEAGWHEVEVAYSAVHNLISLRASLEMVRGKEGESASELPFDDDLLGFFKEQKHWSMWGSPS